LVGWIWKETEEHLWDYYLRGLLSIETYRKFIKGELSW
jgi:hypothetical protein